MITLTDLVVSHSEPADPLPRARTQRVGGRDGRRARSRRPLRLVSPPGAARPRAARARQARRAHCWRLGEGCGGRHWGSAGPHWRPCGRGERWWCAWWVLYTLIYGYFGKYFIFSMLKRTILKTTKNVSIIKRNQLSWINEKQVTSYQFEFGKKSYSFIYMQLELRVLCSKIKNLQNNNLSAGTI